MLRCKAQVFSYLYGRQNAANSWRSVIEGSLQGESTQGEIIHPM